MPPGLYLFVPFLKFKGNNLLTWELEISFPIPSLPQGPSQPACPAWGAGRGFPSKAQPGEAPADVGNVFTVMTHRPRVS